MTTPTFPSKTTTATTRTVTTLLFTVGCLMLLAMPGAAQPAPVDYQLSSNAALPVSQSPFPPPPVGNPGMIPSGIISPKCKAMPAGESMVECFLKDNQTPLPNFPGTMVWYFPELGQELPWTQWPAWAKHDLGVAFKDTVDWYNGGMMKYPGTLAADPLQNLNPLAWKPFHRPVVDGPTAAWRIYIGHLALNLASEIYGWVPWSLRNYDTYTLTFLFHHNFEFWWCDPKDTGADYPAFCNFAESTPTNAITVFKFLKQNNLIGATRIETIGRVLDWARNNLQHISGAYTYTNYAYIWQYLGDPPVSRILTGTASTAPDTPYNWGVSRHWTAGCHGTSAFLIWVFKAVGIPVVPAWVGWHSSIWFAGENLYLSHGDDPYDALSKANYPATMLLIDQARYDAWFPANNKDAGDLNVGRRPAELGVQYPGSQWVLGRYCDDQQAGKSHFDGKVFNEVFKRFYTVQELENANLWQRLDQIAAAQGCSM